MIYNRPKQIDIRRHMDNFLGYMRIVWSLPKREIIATEKFLDSILQLVRDQFDNQDIKILTIYVGDEDLNNMMVKTDKWETVFVYAERMVRDDSLEIYFSEPEPKPILSNQNLPTE